MNVKICLTVLWLTLFAPFLHSFELARDGKAQAPIILSEKASASTKAVAAELASFLKRISGAEFKVETGDGTKGIVLGALTEFPDAALNAPLEIRNRFDGKEAYVIRTEPERIRLIGNTDLGVSHATFRLLEELGCRWFFPGKDWEIIPSQTTINFDKQIADRPVLLSRTIWFEAGSGGEQQNREYVDWKRHNRMAESFSVNAGHNLDAIIHLNKKEFDVHPEYLALVKGKRQGWQLELADPAVRKMVVDYTLDYFKKHPNADMVSLEPADTLDHSESSESLKLGSVSDRVFGMVNEAARALAKEYPDKMIGLYSYNAHWDPPTFEIELNVHVLLANLGQGQLTPDEREKIWPQRCHNLGFYEYYSVWAFSADRLPGSFTNNLKGNQERIKKIASWGGKSINAESTSSWGSNGRGYYIANKLMWNPDADVQALANDFYEKAFGAGASGMKRYYERLDPGTRPFFSKHLLGLAFRDVNEASEATKENPVIQARLDQIKQYLRYVHLDWIRNREKVSEDEKKKLMTQIMTIFYRTRATAFTSWEMIRQNWGGNKYPGKDHEPWMVDTPYTHEETEKDFQEGLNFFQPRNIGTAITYSEELVPVEWESRPETEAKIESNQEYQGSQVYALWSYKGEPLEFTTTAGKLWNGINRFVVRDGKGNEITKGQLPNSATTEHSIKVPGSGLYYLDYNDNGSTWSVKIGAGRAATIPLGSRRDYRNWKVMQDMYFYVPKGIQQIEYYYSRTAYHPGGPHQVLGPDGKVIQDVSINGDWISIPVPQGMDGKLWRFHNPVLGLFWFNNLPNYFAASPQMLLIPREVAEKDGLKIRNAP